MSRRSRRLSHVLAISALVAVVSGCSLLDSGSSEMTWEGAEELSSESETVPTYLAVPELPDLTLADVATSLGQDLPADVTAAETSYADPSQGWTLSVEQQQFGTRVRYANVCQGYPGDPQAAEDAANGLLSAWGSDPETYRLFTIGNEGGPLQAVGEPKIDGHPTWSTGLLVVTVGASGEVCGVSGNMMGFEPADEAVLAAPSEVFSQARQDPELTVEGRFSQVEKTWTLDAEGIVIPAWRFTENSGESFVAVQFGGSEDLETAPDTETFMRAR